MKKGIAGVICIVCLLVAHVVYASNLYSPYLNGDRNFILAGAHMGYAWYVDKSSLVVQNYNPPEYQIAVNVVTVPDTDQGNIEISDVTTHEFYYQWEQRKMYSWRRNAWRYIPPVGTMADTGQEFSGEMAFYMVYHMKFYGGRKWWDAYDGEYKLPNFSENIYTWIDEAE